MAERGEVGSFLSVMYSILLCKMLIEVTFTVYDFTKIMAERNRKQYRLHYFKNSSSNLKLCFIRERSGLFSGLEQNFLETNYAGLCDFKALWRI